MSVEQGALRAIIAGGGLRQHTAGEENVTVYTSLEGVVTEAGGEYVSAAAAVLTTYSPAASTLGLFPHQSFLAVQLVNDTMPSATRTTPEIRVELKAQHALHLTTSACCKKPTSTLSKASADSCIQRGLFSYVLRVLLSSRFHRRLCYVGMDLVLDGSGSFDEDYLTNPTLRYWGQRI